MTRSKKHITPTIPLLVLIVVLILVSLTASSMIITNSFISDKELNEYVDQVIDEITTVITIKNVYGMFSEEKPYHITHMAVLISPLFKESIDLSEWMIQVHTKESLLFYTFNNTVAKQESHTIFTHPSWHNLSSNNFGIISIIDNDESLIQHNLLTDSSDLVFLVFEIPNNFITKGDSITITFSSGTSIRKTINVEIPLPTSSIVSLF